MVSNAPESTAFKLFLLTISTLAFNFLFSNPYLCFSPFPWSPLPSFISSFLPIYPKHSSSNVSDAAVVTDLSSLYCPLAGRPAFFQCTLIVPRLLSFSLTINLWAFWFLSQDHTQFVSVKLFCKAVIENSVFFKWRAFSHLAFPKFIWTAFMYVCMYVFTYLFIYGVLIYLFTECSLKMTGSHPRSHRNPGRLRQHIPGGGRIILRWV